MHVNFLSRVDGPERLVCEAELVFEGDGPLAGLRLVGFALWRGTDGATYVTFPSRAFGLGEERRFFDFLRGDAAAVKRFKAFVLDAFTTQGVAPAVAAAAATETDQAANGAAERSGRRRPH